MLVIALTGGLGAGKSTVASLFAEKNIPVIDADEIAKRIIAPHTDTLSKIINHFGIHILDSEGQLNRKRLRKLIFADKQEKIWLEQLLHPTIIEEIKIQIKKESAAYCIIIIPLLFETNYDYTFINRILLVDTPKHEQVTRVQLRDNISNELIESMLSSQINREERLKKSNDIIMNDGSIEHLHTQVDKLHQDYLQMSKK